jgi:Flp pilus assembly protein TadD
MVNERQWAAVIEVVDGFDSDTRTAVVEWCYGWSLSKIGRTGDACIALRRAVSIKPRNAVFRWALGVVLRDRGDLAGACEELSHALSLKESLPTRLALADVLVAQGDVSEAERLHREGVVLPPRRAAMNATRRGSPW